MSKKHIMKFAVLFQVLLLIVGVLGLNIGVTPARAAAVRIMPLGNSITGSPGCWRALLWNRLQSTGYTNIDFVGTLNNQNDCGITFDGDNDGHGGYLATNIATQNLLPGWLATAKPDVVIMHLGTNDVWNSIAPATILSAFSTLLSQMRASNPNVKLIVAQILPMNPSGCSVCAQNVINFNAAIPAWVSANSTAQSPITMVDQWTGFDDAADTVDGVHPNSTTGIQKVSDKWYPALVAVLSGTSSPTATQTRTRTPTITNTGTRPATTVAPTFTRTRTPTATGTGGFPTAGPTFTPTFTFTPTPTTSSGSTCSPVTSTITSPFSFDGAGTLCWQASTLGTYINSWNLVSLKVNGVAYSNVYVTVSSLPAKINGFWYISYNSTVAWGHFEAK